MRNDFSFSDALVSVSETLLRSVADLVPRLFTAIAVILIGLLVAKIAEKTLRTLFERLKLDALLERMGVIQTLQRFGLRDTPGRLLARTVYMLLIILFTQAVTRAVGLHTIADAIGAFFGYLPNLVAAFLVLLLGMIVAQFLGRTVARSAEEAGIEYAPVLGRLVSALILFVVIIMAVSQLKIDTDIVKQVVLVLLGGFAAALAISFGLGTRDVTRNIVAGFYARKLFDAGDDVEIGGERGSLVVVAAIQTLVRVGDRTVAVPNSVFLESTVRK